MNGKKLVLAAISATLLLGASAGASFARPHGGPGMSPEVMYVRMLKQFDTNKDGQITKDELMSGGEAMFVAIDTDKDGSITPGEFRAYQKEKRKAMHEERQKAREERQKADAGTDNKAKPDDMAMADGNDGPDKKGADGKGGGDMKRHEGRHGDRELRHGKHHGGKMGARLIRFADKDENGQISKEEAKALGEKMFARMDRNKDGVISIDDMPNR